MSKKYKKIEEELSNISDMMDSKSPVIPIYSSEDEDAVSVEVPEVLPILTLRSSVLFPGAITPITVGRNKSMRLVRDIEQQGALLGAVLQKEAAVEDPPRKICIKVGTVARIIKTLEMPNGNLTVILHGLEKFEVHDYVTSEPYYKARVRPLHDINPDKDNVKFEALVESIKDIAVNIIKLSPSLPQEATFAIKNIDSKKGIINFISSNIEFSDADRQNLLEAPGLLIRAQRLLEILVREQQLLQLKSEIQQRVKQDIDAQQREYYLQQQIRTIQDELGGDPVDRELDEMQEKASKRSGAAR